MPNPTIGSLYNEIRNKRSADQSYAPFLEAMDRLNRKLTALMEPTDQGWTMLNKAEIEELAGLYRAAGVAAERYLDQAQKSQDPAEQELRQTVVRLSEFMAADVSAFRRYNPRSESELKSLPTILEEARVPVMDQGSRIIQSVGGAQSSRMPMTIIGPDGRPMAGMFTKADVFDPRGDLDRAFAAAARKANPAGRALLNGFMDRYHRYYTENPDKDRPVAEPPKETLAFLMACRKNENKTTDFTMSTDRVAAEIARIHGMTAEQVQTACGKDALNLLAKQMRGMVFDVYIKTEEVEMTNLTRVDRKNAGMTVVAELLGVPDLICHSRPMKLKGPDGKIVDGTFMAMAEGEDPNRPGPAARQISEKLLRKSGKAIEQIADLQVLDYICGNIDRHGGNVFFRVDENGDLVMQGIDNDSSFGSIKPQTEHIRQMPLPVEMGVISKKTAEKVMNLTEAELAFSLRGMVDEKAIKAACSRLYILQNVIRVSRERRGPGKDIKYPAIQEYDANDFRNMTKENWEKLKGKKRGNHFYEIADTVSRIARAALNQNAQKPTPELIGSENRATEAGVTGQILKGQQFKKLLSDRTSFWRGGSSENYTNLENAVQAYIDQQTRLHARLGQMKARAAAGDNSPKTAVEQYVTRFDMNEMKKGLLRMKEAADTYAIEKLEELARKGKNLKDDPYIEARINAAREISKYAAEQQETTQEEKDAMASNERRALEQIAHRETVKAQNQIRVPNQDQNTLRKEQIPERVPGVGGSNS